MSIICLTEGQFTSRPLLYHGLSYSIRCVLPLKGKEWQLKIFEDLISRFDIKQPSEAYDILFILQKRKLRLSKMKQIVRGHKGDKQGAQ